MSNLEAKSETGRSSPEEWVSKKIGKKDLHELMEQLELQAKEFDGIDANHKLIKGFSEDIHSINRVMREVRDLVDNEEVPKSFKADIETLIEKTLEMKEETQRYALILDKRFKDLKFALETYEIHPLVSQRIITSTDLTVISKELGELSNKCNKIIKKSEKLIQDVSAYKDSFINKLWKALKDSFNRVKLKLMNMAATSIALIIFGVLAASIFWPVGVIVGGSGLLMAMIETYNGYKDSKSTIDEKAKNLDLLRKMLVELKSNVNIINKKIIALQREINGLFLKCVDSDMTRKRMMIQCDYVLEAVTDLIDAATTDLDDPSLKPSPKKMCRSASDSSGDSKDNITNL